MAFFRQSGTGVVFGERYWRVKQIFNIKQMNAVKNNLCSDHF